MGIELGQGQREQVTGQKFRRETGLHRAGVQDTQSYLHTSALSAGTGPGVKPGEPGGN